LIYTSILGSEWAFGWEGARILLRHIFGLAVVGRDFTEGYCAAAICEFDGGISAKAALFLVQDNVTSDDVAVVDRFPVLWICTDWAMVAVTDGS
jgi:hypothetical protein